MTRDSQKADKKKSFKLYKDALVILDKLTDDQAGKLFKAINDYNNGREPDLDPLMEIIFHPFKAQFDRDQEAYNKQCEINAANGAQGGRPSNQINRTEPNETEITENNRTGYLESEITEPNQNNPDIDKDKDKKRNLVERKIAFSKTLEPYLEKYGKDMLNKFYRYWTEETRSKANPKMKWELEKTWSIAGRLATWSERDNQKAGPADKIISAKSA